MESGASINSNYSINDGIRVMTDLRSDEGRTINYDFEVLLEDGSMQCSYVYDCYPLKWTTCLSDGEKISDGYKSYNRSKIGLLVQFRSIFVLFSFNVVLRVSGRSTKRSLVGRP